MKIGANKQKAVMPYNDYEDDIDGHGWCQWQLRKTAGAGTPTSKTPLQPG